MNRQPEFDRTLATALADEAERMDIDLEAAEERFFSSVAEADRVRRRHRVLAVVAAAALVAACVLVGRAVAPWGGDEATLVPAHQSPSLPTGPYVVDLDTGSVSPLSRGLLPRGPANSASLKVSPDGSWLAYTACTVISQATWGCAGDAEGAVMRLDGSERVPLPVTAVQTVGDVVWSPDGRMLAYQLIDPRLPGQQGEEFSVGELYVYDRTTRHSTRVTDIALEKSEWWPLLYSFTADGRSLLYDLPRASGPNASWDVWSVPVDGGAAHRVIPDARAPEALPDGSGIAYVVPMPGSWAGSGVRLLESSGKDREIAPAAVSIDWVAASPDGHRLAYQDRGTTSVVDLMSGATEKVADRGTYGWADDHTLVIKSAP